MFEWRSGLDQIFSGLCRLLAVPLPVGDCVFSLSWLLPTYFLFAVTYDVLQTLAEVAHYLPLYSHSQEPQIHNLTGSLAAANLSTILWCLKSHTKLRWAMSSSCQKTIRSLASPLFSVISPGKCFFDFFNDVLTLSLLLWRPPANANFFF